MSKQSPQPRRSGKVVAAIVTDPAEIAAAEEWSRQYRKTAPGQVGCTMVVDVPLPMLARVIAEAPAEEQQECWKELLDRLPPHALRALDEALQRKLRRGAA
jgi:hypothetical protein